MQIGGLSNTVSSPDAIKNGYPVFTAPQHTINSYNATTLDLIGNTATTNNTKEVRTSVSATDRFSLVKPQAIKRNKSEKKPD